jgi:membrane protease subunit (stomatin/prohibitin family)
MRLKGDIMGLIKALGGAVGGQLGDQWKEFFYCDALDADVLATKGQKRTSKRSTNRFGEENIISNGSLVAVADGQCMIIVEQGKVVDICAEPGEYTYDTSTEPSIFAGNFGESLLNTFKTMGKRFTFGADTGKDQRVYYFNTKEIIGNKYGTATPVPFRVVDKNIGLDIDISIRCNGEYSYKITNPILFYTNVCGNVADEYVRDEIDSMLKTELLTALQPAFAKISAMGIRYSALPGHTTELSTILNDQLSDKWRDLRGLEVASFGINSVSAPKEDEDLIKKLQRDAVLRDPNMAGARLVGSQAQAMEDAAKNEGQGAFMAFAGMNMANNAGGMNANNLFQMGQQQNQQQQQMQGQAANGVAGGPSWICECGNTNTGKFCTNCGKPQPSQDGWTCTKCGTVNKGKFCMNCGTPKPAEALQYACDKCGWEPADPKNPPKFCPECGDPFDDNDAK